MISTCTHVTFCFSVVLRLRRCIKFWLLRNGKCPYCRETFLPIDAHQQVLGKEELRGLAKQRSQRISTTYFCLQDGLVTVRRSDKLHKDILDRIDTLTCPCIKKGELSKLRGSRLEGNNTASNGGGDLGGLSLQVLNPSASSAGPNFGSSFEVALTSPAHNEQSELDSDEEMGILPARSPFREEATAEDRHPAVQLSPELSSP